MTACEYRWQSLAKTMLKAIDNTKMHCFLHIFWLAWFKSLSSNALLLHTQSPKAHEPRLLGISATSPQKHKTRSLDGKLMIYLYCDISFYISTITQSFEEKQHETS